MERETLEPAILRAIPSIEALRTFTGSTSTSFTVDVFREVLRKDGRFGDEFLEALDEQIAGLSASEAWPAAWRVFVVRLRLRASVGDDVAGRLRFLLARAVSSASSRSSFEASFLRKRRRVCES